MSVLEVILLASVSRRYSCVRGAPAQEDHDELFTTGSHLPLPQRETESRFLFGDQFLDMNSLLFY